MAGAYEDRFEDRVGVLGDDSHLEMAFEDAVADPLVNNQEYNDQWQDAAFDEQQEYAYEESLEDFDEDDEE
jgi:hypothetical protein